jgi:hypothetical protein
MPPASAPTHEAAVMESTHKLKRTDKESFYDRSAYIQPAALLVCDLKAVEKNWVDMT